MESEDAGKGPKGPSAKRARKKAAGDDADLLALARSIVGLAKAEITARHEAFEDRTAKSRSVLYRAQESADPEQRQLLDDAYQRLDADQVAAADIVKAKTLVLDDLAHDVAGLAARLKEATRGGGVDVQGST